MVLPKTYIDPDKTTEEEYKPAANARQSLSQLSGISPCVSRVQLLVTSSQRESFFSSSFGTTMQKGNKKRIMAEEASCFKRMLLLKNNIFKISDSFTKETFPLPLPGG